MRTEKDLGIKREDFSSDEEYRKARKKIRTYKWRLDNLERTKEIQQKYQSSEKYKKTKRAWIEKNRKKYLAGRQKADMRCKYGITIENKISMFANQHCKCAICGTVFRSVKEANIDHHHDTGEIRWLLCFHCNSGLGMFNENPGLLRKAADMLESKEYTDRGENAVIVEIDKDGKLLGESRKFLAPSPEEVE